MKQTTPYAVASGGTAWRSQHRYDLYTALSRPATLTSYDVLGSPAQTTALDGALTTLSAVFSFYGSFFYQGL